MQVRSELTRSISPLCAIPITLLMLAASAAAGDAPHTFDGKYEIAKIDLKIVYLVPRDRDPLVDWRERVDYFVKRIQAFHTRESAGRSELRVTVHPKALIVIKTSQEIRGDDPNQTFNNSINEAQTALGWPAKREGFPILLVLSDINWRELDDFGRTMLVAGVPKFEGTVEPDGRHFPGAEAGGARSLYIPDRGSGVGLVSADGWRVPCCGSDCVVYHEGVGHPIGLPHPEPLGDSVMGMAQYRSWLNRTWVDPSQKRALGWADKAGAAKAGPPATERGRDLFTVFTAVPSPAAPKPAEPVVLRFTWPEGASLRSIKIRVQTDLLGPWQTLPVGAPGKPPESLRIGAFDRPTPVSYRVDAILEDGQVAEIWGYFQVHAAEADRGELPRR